LLSPYLDGELPQKRRIALEAHLARCEGCAAELAELGAVWTRLADIGPAPPLPPDLWPRTLAALGEGHDGRSHRRRRRSVVLHAACVAVCAALGFLGGALLSWDRSAAQRPSKAGGEPVEAAIVAEAFGTTANGFTRDTEGLFRCDPR
jgi:anti-sigma factor RsiW